MLIILKYLLSHIMVADRMNAFWNIDPGRLSFVYSNVLSTDLMNERCPNPRTTINL